MFIGNKIKFFNNSVGIVRYLGEVEGQKGQWIGIELDRPCGKNNGTYKGKKYFECADLHGILINENKLKSQLKDSKEVTNGDPLPNKLSSSAENIVKETLYKSKIRKMKREKEKLEIEKQDLQKDLERKDRLLEKYKITTSNILDKISDFEVDAKNIINDVTDKINKIKKLKKEEVEEEEYLRLCTYFKNIIISTLENNTEEVEKSLSEYHKILKRNGI